MRTPKLARFTASRLVLLAAGALLLGACRDQVTAPAPLPDNAAVASTPERESSFQPTAATKALFGVVDGTYAVAFDPTRNQSFSLGPNHLDIPANSVCNLLTSGYGPSFWNTPCSPQTLPVLLTVVIKNAKSSNPSVQFFPALRFSPSKTVQLFMYAPKVSPTDAKNWLMFYCADGSSSCSNEQLTDSDLTTYIDYRNSVLFRRIKHFSGYVVAEFADEAKSALN
jgi:hypothetical protein